MLTFCLPGFFHKRPLAANQRTEAAAEFRNIVDRPGLVGNEPMGELAQFGTARVLR
jgi:hypothetical protein